MSINSHERNPETWRKDYMIDIEKVEIWEKDLAGKDYIYFLDWSALQVNILLKMLVKEGRFDSDKVLYYMKEDW
jgi:hypothetical protein